jgi:hypothetical protein
MRPKNALLLLTAAAFGLGGGSASMNEVTITTATDDRPIRRRGPGPSLRTSALNNRYPRQRTKLKGWQKATSDPGRKGRNLRRA